MLMIHLAATVLALQAAKAAPPAAAVAVTDVVVAISYTGKGTVDANHKVLAWLFADPNVTSASRPVGTPITRRVVAIGVEDTRYSSVPGLGLAPSGLGPDTDPAPPRRTPNQPFERYELFELLELFESSASSAKCCGQ